MKSALITVVGRGSPDRAQRTVGISTIPLVGYLGEMGFSRNGALEK
jgi:hypothetical protein